MEMEKNSMKDNKNNGNNEEEKDKHVLHVKMYNSNINTPMKF